LLVNKATSDILLTVFHYSGIKMIIFVVFTLTQDLFLCSQWWTIAMIVLAKTMEHVTTIWKTTLVLVMQNLQDKTVKVCLSSQFVCVYFIFSAFPRESFLGNISFIPRKGHILEWVVQLLCTMFIDTALFTVKDHCYNSPCQNSGNCSNLPDTYKCTCHPGFTGQNCEGGF